MARKGGGASWRMRLIAVLFLAAAFAGMAAWWNMRHWTPSRKAFPMQGAEIGLEDGPVDWTALKTIGTDFVYLDASASAFARDDAFVKNLDEARAAGLQVGALHVYDPCQPADKQAANFVTVVPRDPKMLPPAVELDREADDCPTKVSEAAVTSELMTFVNQVETHTGKPVILKLSWGFEHKYKVAHAIDRNLWLVRPRFEPDYGGRPWTMWTANSMLVTEADDRPLRWVVVQP